MLRISLSALVIAGNLGLALLPAVTAPAGAQAASGEPTRIRGSIVTHSKDSLTVTTREGATVDLALADGWQIASVARANVEDINPGDFVGIASLSKADGGDGALEVLIFPDALRGTGEGSYDWDLQPKSRMTNATVANAVSGVDGHSVTVTYHGQQKTIDIPDGTPVVTLAPATPDDLTAGATVFVSATKDGSGRVTAGQVVVGKDGVVPPM